MPSVSKAQARTMAAAAHSPAFAKKIGIPVSVAKEFNAADTGNTTDLPERAHTFKEHKQRRDYA